MCFLLCDGNSRSRAPENKITWMLNWSLIKENWQWQNKDTEMCPSWHLKPSLSVPIFILHRAQASLFKHGILVKNNLRKTLYHHWRHGFVEHNGPVLWANSYSFLCYVTIFWGYVKGLFYIFCCFPLWLPLEWPFFSIQNRASLPIRAGSHLIKRSICHPLSFPLASLLKKKSLSWPELFFFLSLQVCLHNYWVLLPDKQGFAASSLHSASHTCLLFCNISHVGISKFYLIAFIVSN